MSVFQDRRKLSWKPRVWIYAVALVLAVSSYLIVNSGDPSRSQSEALWVQAESIFQKAHPGGGEEEATGSDLNVYLVLGLIAAHFISVCWYAVMWYRRERRDAKRPFVIRKNRPEPDRQKE
ncbi:hypothetical protein OVA24_10835 [Luteolibacter sp. SL250]|uniref:hypothetical protein n=1 Tax=Luteolibacter sp. SL250 TaxID=2995170 RepID=UPI00226FCC55|nr:hypothetical protein [Luteolibacter sp. SL250]WAC21878.1 hypothetical protein OVA24_10835 [Luteolibacter sp. SL250]